MKKLVSGLLALLILGLAACKTTDLSVNQLGSSNNVDLVVKDFELLGEVTLSAEEVKEFGPLYLFRTNRGARLNYTALLTEAAKFGADDIIDINIIVNQNRKTAPLDFFTGGKVTYTYTGTAQAIKYTTATDRVQSANQRGIEAWEIPGLQALPEVKPLPLPGQKFPSLPGSKPHPGKPGAVKAAGPERRYRVGAWGGGGNDFAVFGLVDAQLAKYFALGLEAGRTAILHEEHKTVTEVFTPPPSFIWDGSKYVRYDYPPVTNSHEEKRDIRSSASTLALFGELTFKIGSRFELDVLAGPYLSSYGGGHERGYDYSGETVSGIAVGYNIGFKLGPGLLFGAIRGGIRPSRGVDYWAGGLGYKLILPF